MNLKIFLIALVVIVLFFFGYDLADRKIKSLEMEVEYYRQEAKNFPYVERIVRDTVYMAQQPITELPKSDFKKQTANRDVLNEVGSSSSLVMLESKISKTFADTVKPLPINGVFHHHDHWADITFNLHDSIFVYEMRDSLNILITKRYKHRFWFIRWGKKTYDITLLNFNPHSKITYLSTVAVK